MNAIEVQHLRRIYRVGRCDQTFDLRSRRRRGRFLVTMSTGGDRWNGTLPYLLGTPANRLTMFLGRAFMYVIEGMVGVIIGLLRGMLLLGLDLSETSLPPWMQVISAVLPLTRSIASARLLIAGASLSDVAPLLAGEFAIGVIYALLGYGLFH